MKSGRGFVALAFLAGTTAAFAQASNENKPAAPAPSKAAPLETGGKPEPVKGAGAAAKPGMTKSTGKATGMMKGGATAKAGAMKKKH